MNDEKIDVPLNLLKQLKEAAGYMSAYTNEEEHWKKVYEELNSLIPKPKTNEELITEIENGFINSSFIDADKHWEEIKKRLRNHNV